MVHGIINREEIHIIVVVVEDVEEIVEEIVEVVEEEIRDLDVVDYAD